MTRSAPAAACRHRAAGFRDPGHFRTAQRRANLPATTSPVFRLAWLQHRVPGWSEETARQSRARRRRRAGRARRLSAGVHPLPGDAGGAVLDGLRTRLLDRAAALHCWPGNREGTDIPCHLLQRSSTTPSTPCAMPSPQHPFDVVFLDSHLPLALDDGLWTRKESANGTRRWKSSSAPRKRRQPAQVWPECPPADKCPTCQPLNPYEVRQMALALGERHASFNPAASNWPSTTAYRVSQPHPVPRPPPGRGRGGQADARTWPSCTSTWTASVHQRRPWPGRRRQHRQARRRARLREIARGDAATNRPAEADPGFELARLGSDRAPSCCCRRSRIRRRSTASRSN